jgi:hypothetical protein
MIEGGARRIRWPRYAAAAVGLGWYLQIGGGPTLNPGNVGWLMAGDWMQHWLGWLFFLREPWSFPLGRVDSLLYPIGTNIGFTDSNPLVSLLLKPFAGFMPAYAQVIGPWLAACFMLQGYAGAALAGTVTERPWQRFLGGCLLALSPVLVARIGHEALCAHWLLLGLLYLGLREANAASAKRTAGWAAAAAVLSASIHPYLAAMCWVLAHAVLLRLWLSRGLTLVEAAAAAFATTAGMLAAFGLIGYFGAAQLGLRGFDVFSADLLTLVNPMGHSRFLPTLSRIPAAQWEGFGYLGLGGIILAVVAAAGSIVGRPSVPLRVWIVGTVCFVMAVYALSNVVTFNGSEVLRVRGLAPGATPFRASGRFLWSFHYLLLLFGIWGATRAFRPPRAWMSTALLATAVAVQAADVTLAPSWFEQKHFREARLFSFRAAIGHYRHLALYPAQVLEVTGAPFEEDVAYRYMLLACKLRATYNSGHFARVPARQVLEAAERTGSAVLAGNLDPQTIYVVWTPLVKVFQDRHASCGRIDGDWICVSADGHEAFRKHLEANAGPSPQAP